MRRCGDTDATNPVRGTRAAADRCARCPATLNHSQTGGSSRSFSENHRRPLDFGTPVDDDALTAREPDHELTATHPRRNLNVCEVGLCEHALETPMIHGRLSHDHLVTLHPQHPAPSSRPEGRKGPQNRGTSAESNERGGRNAVLSQIGGQ